MNPEQAQFLATYLLRGLEGEIPITRKVLASVPDNKLSWRPHQKGRSAAELAWHIAAADVWFLEGIAKGSFAMEGERTLPKTIAEIVSYYEKNFPAALAKVKALPAQKLAETVNFMGIFDHPAVVYLSFCSNHSIHHRGQLAAYLRAMGEKVPSIYGGSADEPFDAAKAAAS